jgi:uncharacterized membrane protein YczE
VSLRDEAVATQVVLSRWLPTPARLARLLLGLCLFGCGEALLVASKLGNSPWTVLGQGVARIGNISVGVATIAISGVVLCAWIPLRQRPGLGTILNALLIGIAIDVTLNLLPARLPLSVRAAMVPGGVAAVAVGSGLYLTSRLGPGPRDGLMTGLHRSTGHSLRLVRALLELTVTALGIVMGGTFGIGTITFALLIGPSVQFCVHRLGGHETQSL